MTNNNLDNILKYFENLKNLYNDILDSEEEKMKRVSQKISEVVERGGLIYLFGCGHSQLMAQEVFYRAGGLAPLQPMLDEGLSLKNGAARASKLEKLEGYANTIFENYNPTENDLLIIISVSGRNSVPIEMALKAKEKEIETVAITSVEEYDDVSSRHYSGKKLYEVVDIAIDDKVPYGDAILNIGDSSQKTSPVSGPINSAILHSVMGQASLYMDEKMEEVPVFKSGNIEGGTEFNEKLIQKFKNRIIHL